MFATNIIWNLENDNTINSLPKTLKLPKKITIYDNACRYLTERMGCEPKSFDLVEAKTFDVRVFCNAYYDSSLEVPSGLSWDEAITYANEHSEEIPITELDWFSDYESDAIDETESDWRN